MKVAFLIGNMSHPGGTERVLALIANGLLDKGYKPVIISMWGENDTYFYLDKQIRRYRLRKNYPKGFDNLRNISNLNDIIKKEKITILVDVDLILTFYSLPIKIRNSKLKLISWEHFNYYYQFRKNNLIRRIAIHLAAKFSDMLVVLSKEDERYYRKKLHMNEKLIQIYNPNTYENAVTDKKREHTILAAGRLTRAKGFDYLIECWSFMEKSNPDWQLLIAGDGEEKENLLAMIKEKGLTGVTLLGNVQNIETHYEKASIFVLPSRCEGFGMVLIEAMAYELPVVSFSCKAGPSDIITDGEDGYLVPVGDVRSLADKLQHLIDSEALRLDMGKRAKESTKRFNREHILKEWDALLKQFQ